MTKESKIVKKVNERDFNLIEKREFKTKCNTFNYFVGFLTGNFGPEERLNFRINKYANKIKADKMVVDMKTSTLYHMPVNSAKESGWSESFYIADASFYKEKRNSEKLLGSFIKK